MHVEKQNMSHYTSVNTRFINIHLSVHIPCRKNSFAKEEISSKRKFIKGHNSYSFCFLWAQFTKCAGSWLFIVYLATK